jgi:hypothetical protein
LFAKKKNTRRKLRYKYTYNLYWIFLKLNKDFFKSFFIIKKYLRDIYRDMNLNQFIWFKLIIDIKKL